MKTNTIKIVLLPVLVLFIFSSCHEKGCMDKNALNFNVTADQDDGSCIVCKTQVNNLATQSIYLVDNNFSSPFFNVTVARFDLTQPLTSFNYSECGKGTCTVNLSVANLINKNMTVGYRLFNFSGPVNINAESTIVVNADSTSNQGIINTFNSPPFLPITADSIIVETFNNITYF